MSNRGINKVIVVGNVGQQPKTRTFEDGNVVSMLSVATSESWRDKKTGEKQERTEWHQIRAADKGNFKLGKFVADYVTKGAKIYVEGSLKTRKYQKDGIDQFSTEIHANELQILDSRLSGSSGSTEKVTVNQTEVDCYIPF